jgi:hypothetical protein
MSTSPNTRSASEHHRQLGWVQLLVGAIAVALLLAGLLYHEELLTILAGKGGGPGTAEPPVAAGQDRRDHELQLGVGERPSAVPVLDGQLSRRPE